MIPFGFSEFLTKYVIIQVLMFFRLGWKFALMELFKSVWLREYSSNPCLVDRFIVIRDSPNSSPPFWEALCRGFAGLNLSASIEGRLPWLKSCGVIFIRFVIRLPNSSCQ